VERVEPLLQRFRFIVDFIHVSAACEVALSDLFFKAIDSVINPISPLFDVASADLKPEAVYAIHRLFRCYDQDMDGVLNKSEMSKIQQRCFDLVLEEEDLESLRQVVVGEGRGGLVTDDGFTVEGLVTLCRHFVEENKAQVVWKMLRQTGFDTDLKLTPPSALSAARLSDAGVVFQLRPAVWDFLDRIFVRFDSNKDGLLDAADVAEVFSVLPRSIRGRSPWCTPTSASSLGLDAPAIDQRQWRAYWAQTVALSTVVASQMLFYLGFLGDDFDKASDVANYLTCVPAPGPASMTQRRRRLGIGYGLDSRLGRGLASITLKVLVVSPDEDAVRDVLRALSQAPGSGDCCKISSSSWPHDTTVDGDGSTSPDAVGYEHHGVDDDGSGRHAEPRIHVVFAAQDGPSQIADLVLLLYEEASDASIRAALDACDALPPWQGRAFIRRPPESGGPPAPCDARVESKCLKLGIPEPFDLRPEDQESAANAASGVVVSVLGDHHMPKSLARFLARTIASTPTWYSAIIALAVGGLIAAVGYELWKKSTGDQGDSAKESASGRDASQSVGKSEKLVQPTSLLDDVSMFGSLPGNGGAEERVKLCQLPSRHPYLLLFAEWAGTLRA